MVREVRSGLGCSVRGKEFVKRSKTVLVAADLFRDFF